MPNYTPDAFALKNSGLDAFLYADVGAELNGSPLTILSVLARLGKDPWAKAACWAALPTAAAIDGLSQSIAQMPLARAGSRDIAARLAQLLPGKPRHVVPAPAGASKVGSGNAELGAGRDGLLWYHCQYGGDRAAGVKVFDQRQYTIEQQIAITGSTSSAVTPLPLHATAGPPSRPALRGQER